MAAQHPPSERSSLRPGRVLATTLTVLGLAALVVWLAPADRLGVSSLDLRVYRGAAEAMLAGRDLYGFGIADVNGAATFLYPPFAALLAVPTTWLPLGSVITAWLIVQFALAAIVVGTLLWYSGRARCRGLADVTSVVGVGALFVFSRPVMMGLHLGQVSLLVTTLVVIDLLLLPRRWQGILIGIAGAIKLTPLFFVVFLLGCRRWRAAAAAIATFLAASVVGFLLLPAESATYWTTVVFDSGRVPGFNSERNLGLLGVLTFWSEQAAWVKPLWILAGAALAAAALGRAVRHHRRGERVEAVVVVGLGATVLSPVAWDHFYVWLVVAALHLALGNSRFRPMGWGLVAAVSLASPIWPAALFPPGFVHLAVIPCLAATTLMVVGLPAGHERSGASLPTRAEPELAAT